MSTTGACAAASNPATKPPPPAQQQAPSKPLLKRPPRNCPPLNRGQLQAPVVFYSAPPIRHHIVGPGIAAPPHVHYSWYRVNAAQRATLTTASNRGEIRNGLRDNISAQYGSKAAAMSGTYPRRFSVPTYSCIRPTSSSAIHCRSQALGGDRCVHSLWQLLERGHKLHVTGSMLVLNDAHVWCCPCAVRQQTTATLPSWQQWEKTTTCVTMRGCAANGNTRHTHLQLLRCHCIFC